MGSVLPLRRPVRATATGGLHWQQPSPRGKGKAAGPYMPAAFLAAASPSDGDRLLQLLATFVLKR